MNNLVSLKKKVSHNLQCVLGASVNKKIIVIESDDWGSIRMSSKGAFNHLKEKNKELSNSPYNKYDSLASEEDLELLFGVLSKYRGSDGNPPIITANTIMTNPDFDRIQKDKFQSYHYELFTTTLKRYGKRENSFELWNQGIASKIFKPQLHGREHLNFKRWLKLLNNEEGNLRDAFDYQVFGVPLSTKTKMYHNVMGAFDLDEYSELNSQKQNVKEGALLFKQVFGYSSNTFIAPNYIWHSEIEKGLSEVGVKGIQGGLFQFIPQVESNSYKKKAHFLGQKNSLGQHYMVRNCFFEPSLNRDHNWVQDCLNRMNIAFSWNKPAIICSHRLNYIGSIDSTNRDQNLKQLDLLLGSITRKWPDAIFISSDELENYLN